jgi:S1-C subfamily serine protease
MRSPTIVTIALATITSTLATARAWADATARAEALAIADTFADVADEVAPSVVAVTSAQVESASNPAPLNRSAERLTAPTVAVNGSGLVVDARGDIVTDSSMVTGANHVMVTLPSGRSANATIVGTDMGSGLAVIRVAGAHLVPAKLGDARRMRTGQWVLALGRAGKEHMVSVGVLVSKESTHLIGARVDPYLETDALLDPQNIGGALANLDGKVVGVCLLSEGRGTMGRAVPAWRVRQAVDSITRGARLSSRARTIR